MEKATTGSTINFRAFTLSPLLLRVTPPNLKAALRLILFLLSQNRTSTDLTLHPSLLDFHSQNHHQLTNLIDLRMTAQSISYLTEIKLAIPKPLPSRKLHRLWNGSIHFADSNSDSYIEDLDWSHHHFLNSLEPAYARSRSLTFSTSVMYSSRFALTLKRSIRNTFAKSHNYR